VKKWTLEGMQTITEVNLALRKNLFEGKISENYFG
jgi:hypothetical protein